MDMLVIVGIVVAVILLALVVVAVIAARRNSRTHRSDPGWSAHDLTSRDYSSPADTPTRTDTPTGMLGRDFTAQGDRGPAFAPRWPGDTGAPPAAERPRTHGTSTERPLKRALPPEVSRMTPTRPTGSGTTRRTSGGDVDLPGFDAPSGSNDSPSGGSDSPTSD